jgi:NADH dehydrogenase FAD-containing subunit
VQTEAIVTSVDADGVDVRGAADTNERYRSKTTIWAAGVSASPLAKIVAEGSGAELDHAGRIIQTKVFLSFYNVKNDFGIFQWLFINWNVHVRMQSFLKNMK